MSFKILNGGSHSSPKIWLMADRGVVLSGSTVSQWQDQSGNGNHAIQNVETNQPLLSINSTFNDTKTIRFNDSDNFMVLNLVNPIFVPFTVFIVLDAVAAGGAGSVYMDNRAYGFTIAWQTNTLYGSLSNSYAKTLPIQSVLCLIYNGNNSYFYENSVEKFSGNDTTSKLHNDLYISSVAGSSYFAGCDISEIMIYDEAVSNNKRGFITNYLNSKYKIY